MQETVGKDFFERIRRNVQISYFIASIIPLAILTYFSVKYVYPYLTKGTAEGVPIHVELVLLLTLFMSVLGFFLSTKATNASIKSLKDFYEKLNSLVEVTKQFRETLYVDILLESIVKSAMHLNSAESGSLLLYDEQDNLRFKVVVGERGQEIKETVVKRGEGVSGWVAETGKSAIINDVTKDERFSLALDKKTGFKTRSVMCVPLIHSNEIIGVIEVVNKKTGVFTSEEEKLLYSLADQAAISIAQSRIFESRHSDLIHITEILLGAQDYHCPDKKGHSRRVANYTTLIARNMGFSENELKNLYHASIFHDIGFLKISVSDQDQKEQFMKHPQIGYEMIRPISLWRDSAEIILCHHERYDGAGYPLSKKNEEIPLGAKILSVADTFDVITSKHSYKQKIDFNAALREIEANSGTQFDPEVVKAFKTAITDTMPDI